MVDDLMPPPPAFCETPLGRLARASFSCFWLKILAGPLLMVVLMGVYFGLQKYHLGVRFVLEPGFLDQLLPFHPYWAVPYLWLYAQTGLSSMLLETRRELRDWWILMCVLPIPAWLCFFFAQTEYPRPQLETVPWPYEAVIRMDAPLNVTPCLHSAFSLLAALGLARSLRRFGFGKGALTLNWLVCAAVILGIVGTRQHRVLDIALSLPLTAAGWWWFRSRHENSGTMPHLPRS